MKIRNPNNEIYFTPLRPDTFATLGTTLQFGTFVRPKRTQYDIAMSDCFEYSVSSQ